VTSVSFDVPIIDDNILEDNENFNLKISSIRALFENRFSSFGQIQTTVIIMDNDCKFRCNILVSIIMTRFWITYLFGTLVDNHPYL